MWVKICGTTNLEDGLAAAAAGADALGFVFARSPRRIEPAAARDIIAALPAAVDKVGVFVNESAERIRAVAEQSGLTMVQLHGEESADFARELVEAGVRVVKAVPVRGGFGARMLAFVDSAGVEAVLLDTEGALRGGSGLIFDWRSVAQYLPRNGEDIRMIVAGGLNPLNVADAIRVLRPWGVDVASGVEREPGKKDHEKVRAFVRAAKQSPRSPGSP